MNLLKHQSKSHILNIKKSITVFIFSIAIFSAITSVNSANSYALTYESQANVGFTINDTINLSITGEITIPELFPGTTGESNIVDIKVSTNTKNGYSLSAKMGTTSADLTTTSSSSKFTGLPTNASESTLADDTWGYKIKTGDSSWSNYSGLPISTDTEKILVERNSQPTGGEEITQFKIGARASTSMPADTYSNTIIFHAVANSQPEPTPVFSGITTMQEMTPEICAAETTPLSTATTSTSVHTDDNTLVPSIQLEDTRDNKLYWVSKLADGNCWMVQNLDHNIDSAFAYTSANTDIPSTYTLDNPWTPINNTYTDGTWEGSEEIPESYDPGNYYWNGIENENEDYSITDLDTFGNPHYHIGNYYNYLAALAANSISELSYPAEQSICPAGWTLPMYEMLGSIYQFDSLIFQYWQSGAEPTYYNSPLYITLGGGIWVGEIVLSPASYAVYWTSGPGTEAVSFNLWDGYYGLTDEYVGGGAYGNSVRCVAR